MKAAVLHAISDLKVEQVADPVAGQGDVLVKVLAAGVCSTNGDNGTTVKPEVPAVA